MKLPALAMTVAVAAAGTVIALTTTAYAVEEKEDYEDYKEVQAVTDVDKLVLESQKGIGTVYWPGDGNCGNERADAQPFTDGQCHVAHRTWPLGAHVRVCSTVTKKCTLTKINDRGPYGACDEKGVDPVKLTCKGRWLVKRRRSDKGRWRGVVDMTRCVWKKIGGPGIQIVKLDLLINPITVSLPKKVATATMNLTPGHTTVLINFTPFLKMREELNERHHKMSELWADLPRRRRLPLL